METLGQKTHEEEIVVAVSTENSYGNITIQDESIALVVGHTALECYGVVDLVPRGFVDNFLELFKKRTNSRGIKILTIGDRIHIDLDIILKYGVSINAVAESVRRSVKYNVEQFTGMIVDAVNINVVGVKV